MQRMRTFGFMFLSIKVGRSTRSAKMVSEVCRVGPAGVTELGALWASEGTKLKVVGRDEAKLVPPVLLLKIVRQCVEQIAREDDR